MNKHPGWLVVLAQLGLAAAWAMNAFVYIVTPKPMAKVLAMTDGVRQGLGVAMATAVALLVAGMVVRGRPFLAAIATAVLAVAGVTWSAYDASRHWTAFAYFHAALAAVAIGLVLAQRRRG